MTHQLIAILLLLTGIACAQIDRVSSDIVRRLRIRVVFSDHAGCDASTRVSLGSNTSFSVAESSVDGECMAEFYDVPSGRYRVTVKGRDAANSDEGIVEVNSIVLQQVEVHAKHTQNSDPIGAAASASFVSVKDLQMPMHAAKEFDKASQLIEKQDWEKAYGHLRKGLGDYSNFAAGYNNLGAVYVHLGKLPEAEEALQKAISLDGRLGPAYVNLARIRFIQKDYAGAESFLNKAIEVTPVKNYDELSLLAYAELADAHLTQAIATSKEGHELQFKQHAYLHLIAAMAYERQRKISECISELRAYVNEEPGGVQADKVKAAIATLEAQLAANQSSDRSKDPSNN